MELVRHLGISYNAAWCMKQKLMQVMLERDQQYKLSGFIELDDAYLGGERTGCKPGRWGYGRGARGSFLFWHTIYLCSPLLMPGIL